MSERERLVELLLESEPIKERDLDDGWGDNEISDIAEYLLDNGVIVPPCEKVYCIADKNTKYVTISSVDIQELCIYEIKNLSQYGYYLTREQAEKALKGGAE